MILPLGFCSKDAKEDDPEEEDPEEDDPEEDEPEASMPFSTVLPMPGRRTTLRDDWGGASQSVTVGGNVCG
jgi:hypothetical protein